MFPVFGPDVSGSAFNPSDATIKLGAIGTLSASGAGSGVDFQGATGTFFAIQIVGTMTGSTPSITGQIQQSSDNSTWTNCTGGAFTEVTSGPNLQMITPTITERYVRYSYTIGGSLPSIPAGCVLISPNQ